ncbi:MAG TPA: 1-(5-phosphoribosyl)-5-[(5-phosphoribosylamino)methylideneamino] imidazole-4-carboxamide isomerase [Acidobacteriota bacterium]|nr:1-(5-phosphoribosyl)-5-[(5-phosphoribosylamino)methylideneamino] imidazole-4-carboxamide isomerase [Acidobacteriota bacterium]
MIVHAAIDLLDSEVVQLVQGDPARERLRLSDAVQVAQDWMASGAPALHVIDLDAALGRGGNGDLLEALLGIAQVPVQVGGGVRSRADVERWSRAGATRVVVGTRAVRDPEWLAAIVASHPDFVVLAADVRAGLVVVDGWQSDTRSSPSDLLRACEDLALAAVLVTDVGREGTLSGVDVELFETLAAKTRHPLIAAGSITTMDDLDRLQEAGVAEAVVGTSLYTGAISVEQLRGAYWR